MKREQLAEKFLDIKREKGWSWKTITNEIGGMSPILVVGALLGQMKLPKALAERAASLFGLAESEKRMLNEVPMRGGAMPPTDPLLYRFYELVMVNGPALKALIEEEFGDGIMSAIDFDLEIDRLANPKGDRVRLVMSGKFLPYKYYGAEQGVPEDGLRRSKSDEPRPIPFGVARLSRSRRGWFRASHQDWGMRKEDREGAMPHSHVSRARPAHLNSSDLLVRGKRWRCSRGWSLQSGLPTANLRVACHPLEGGSYAAASDWIVDRPRPQREGRYLLSRRLRAAEQHYVDLRQSGHEPEVRQRLDLRSKQRRGRRRRGRPRREH